MVERKGGIEKKKVGSVQMTKIFSAYVRLLRSKSRRDVRLLS